MEYTDGYGGKRKAKRKSSKIPYVVLWCTTERQTWRFLATLWKQQVNDYPNSLNKRILDEERINQGLRNINHK